MFQRPGVKQTLARAIKLKWDVANFAEIYRNWLREQWNQLRSDESDNDDSEDESDTDDECQYESSDEEWKWLEWKLLVEITTFLFNFLVNMLT